MMIHTPNIWQWVTAFPIVVGVAVSRDAFAGNVSLQQCIPTATVVTPDDVVFVSWLVNSNDDVLHELSFDTTFLAGGTVPGLTGGVGMIGTPFEGVMTQYYQGQGYNPPCTVNPLYCANFASISQSLGAYTSPTPPQAGDTTTCSYEYGFIDNVLAGGVSYPNNVFVVQLGPNAQIHVDRWKSLLVLGRCWL